MAPVARQYALVLFAILARPWTWLMLGFGLLYVVPFATYWMRGEFQRDDTIMKAVSVVDGPPLVAVGVADVEAMSREGRLDRVTDLDTEAIGRQEGWDSVAPDGRGGFQLTGAPEERPGGWPTLDRLPSLERLWMSPPDMLSEDGWRRIGAHASIEVLSLRNVSCPDPQTLGRFPEVARAALERLPKLRQLDLRGTGGSFELLLPRLPGIEVLAIGHGRLEENLRTLADGSPRLHTLGLETWPGHAFTPSMVETLKRMPRLRTLSVAAATRAADEPAQRRQVAELARALPGVRVLPGSYSPSRIWTVMVASLLAMFVPFVFWFQACVLLSTAPNWMLPRRLGPHLFWPAAVSAVCGGMLVGVARSTGAAWLPAISLALFVTGLGAYGAMARDSAGLPARVTGAVLRADVVAVLLLAGLALFGRPFLDRWLIGMHPALDGVLVVAAAAGLVWKLVRLARVPRILAEQGGAAIPGLTLDAQATMPRDRSGSPGTGVRFDLRWWFQDAAIDRQVARPLPADVTRAPGFAVMLRRQQSQWQVPLVVTFMFAAMGGMFLFLPWIIAWGSDTPAGRAPRGGSHLFGPAFVAMFAWQGCVMAIAITAGLWGQRRASLVVDFLRPVSRYDYWRGIRRAIAADLVLPTLLGGGALLSAVGWYGGGKLLPWAVTLVVLVACIALVHAMILVLATTKWPLVMSTLAGFLFLGAAMASAVAFGHAMTPVQPEHVRTAWLAAGAVATLGLGVRFVVLHGLDAREIG